MGRDIFIPTIGVVKWQPACRLRIVGLLRFPANVLGYSPSSLADRCHSLPSLLPPPAAVGSLPMVGMTVSVAVAAPESLK